MRPQQAEKLQLQIDALEAGIETVSMQIRELKNHASQPQLYTSEGEAGRQAPRTQRIQPHFTIN
jgi:hypothetical protein